MAADGIAPGTGAVIRGRVVKSGGAVRLHGVVWGNPFADTAIVQLPSGALIAVPVEDLEEQ